MDNMENLCRPESTLPSDGVYVPTQQDWDEANAHWDSTPDEGEVANPFDYCDDEEWHPSEGGEPDYPDAHYDMLPDFPEWGGVMDTLFLVGVVLTLTWGIYKS